jgi:type IV secretory pathway TraG/TraD family ATPase VirD4
MLQLNMAIANFILLVHTFYLFKNISFWNLGQCYVSVGFAFWRNETNQPNIYCIQLTVWIYELLSLLSKFYETALHFKYSVPFIIIYTNKTHKKQQNNNPHTEKD